MANELYSVFSIFSFALGACIASFLNVVIYRVPKGESIVRPPSHCPKCNAAIKWWQNIPILSYIALRGRCAACKTRISPRYLLVETIGAFLFLFAFWRFGIAAPLAWVWLSLMIAGSFIDYDYKLLPDFVTIGGIIYGIAISVAGLGFTTWKLSLAGAIFGFGLLWLVRALGSIAFRREAMGMGDVFLMGAIGAIFGPVAVLFCIIFSSLVGSIFGVTMIMLSKTRLGGFMEIPYGPYICAACILWMFHGPEIVVSYLHMLGLN